MPPVIVKGNKLGKGGKRPGAGRPSNQKREVRRLAGILARKFIEDNLKPILEAYVGMGGGITVGKRKFDLDPATTRHAVDKFVSDAAKELDVNMKADDFFRAIQESKK